MSVDREALAAAITRCLWDFYTGTDRAYAEDTDAILAAILPLVVAYGDERYAEALSAVCDESFGAGFDQGRGVALAEARAEIEALKGDTDPARDLVEDAARWGAFNEALAALGGDDA